MEKTAPLSVPFAGPTDRWKIVLVFHHRTACAKLKHHLRMFRACPHPAGQAGHLWTIRAVWTHTACFSTKLPC